jgi:hypothetical protein
MKTPSDILEARRVTRIVTKHLLTQNRRSLHPDGIHCAYRGAGGTKCAVGCLIPDTAYRKSLEGHSVNHPSVKQALIAKGVDMRPLVHEALVILQRIHDMTLPKYWPTLLADVKAALYVYPSKVSGALRNVYYSETFRHAVRESMC